MAAARSRPWLTPLLSLLGFLFAFISPISVAGICRAPPTNRVAHACIVERFEARRKAAEFVGQREAVRTVRSELEAFSQLNLGDQKKPLVFYFYGPSGVGKTMMAQIVADSIFAPCRRSTLDELKVWGQKMFQKKRCQSEIDACASASLEDSLDVCGVLKGRFTSADRDPLRAHAALEALLNAACEELAHGKPVGDGRHSGLVLILDDFQHCTNDCEKLLRKFVTQEVWQHTKSYRTCPLRDVVVLVTSDTTEAMELRPGDSFRKAKDKVQDYARQKWGEGKLWCDGARMVPFFQLSNEEIREIVNRLLLSFERDVRASVELALRNLVGSEHPAGFVVDAKWTGNFEVDYPARDEIMRRLWEPIATTNARAVVEDFQAALSFALRDSGGWGNIGARLTQRKPQGVHRDEGIVSYLGYMGVPTRWEAVKSGKGTSASRVVLSWSQDIVLRFVGETAGSNWIELGFVSGDGDGLVTMGEAERPETNELASPEENRPEL